MELADALTWTATLNGVAVPADHATDNRIRLTGLAEHNVLVVEATLPCVTSGDGMHRYVDPADDATVRVGVLRDGPRPTRLRLLRPARPEATLALRVSAPEDWTVLSYGREVARDGTVRAYATRPGCRRTSSRSPPAPGTRWSWEHAGLPFGWHARRSLAPALDRDAEELRRVTEACFDQYATIFDEPFAFDSYDQVMVPGLNWGAMEFPGCVTFRDELAFPVARPRRPHAPRHGDRARDGAHVVRRPGDAAVVGGHLAERVVR